jgi:hypothetical protein
MELITILNRCYRQKGFVYRNASFVGQHHHEIEVSIVLENTQGPTAPVVASLAQAMTDCRRDVMSLFRYTLLEQMDDRYQLIRITLPTRKRFYQDIAALTTYMLFDSFDSLLDFMMKGLEIGPYAPGYDSGKGDYSIVQWCYGHP